MKYQDFINDVRCELFVFIAALSAFVAGLIDRVRDRLNGDVDSVLTSFAKFEARLARANEAALKAARRADAKADRFDAKAFAAEQQADEHRAAADRAKRVQKRIAKLLD